eukprot:CAMPEP_0197187390 /NCGR_PEP_ID=MMETSP1423-20130617/15767_1 /TAXON_ID=476441 /ORGANISM="Pseudo-nitzschia heimii, Strain UNC1101" /LENGTH=1092 /DNA_ID=CAMNT_0042638951 /DNA_START=108 /DNA_END=3386 /DNA_ORIENTATION=-
MPSQTGSGARGANPGGRKFKKWVLLLFAIIVKDGLESLLSRKKQSSSDCRRQHYNKALTLAVHSLKPIELPIGFRPKDRLVFSSSTSFVLPLNYDVNGIASEDVRNLETTNESDRHTNNGIGTTKSVFSEKSTISTNDRNADIQSIRQGNDNLRNEHWLEDATNKFSDVTSFPLGNLTEDDVVSLTGLMVAWSRRRSLEAAMVVEKLLKRIVDDMEAGNRDVHVSTRMYTIAMEAWGKADEVAGAERAQSIHDAMVQTYKEIKDSRIKPTTKSYNTLILAWAKSKNPVALQAAEKALREMLTESTVMRIARPNAVTCGIMLDFYSRQNCGISIKKAESLFRSMDGLKIKKTNYVYSAFQEVYLRSGRKDAPKKTMAVLKLMLLQYSSGDDLARPRIANFNNVLSAYSRSRPKRNCALQAIKVLNRIETPKKDGGYDVEPDRLSYFLTILTCSRCSKSRSMNHAFGAKLAEQLLVRMEEKSKAEAKRREELSITAPPLVFLDIECFNVVLSALSKSQDVDAVDRIFDIISRMEKYANDGNEELRPNTRSLNAALNALSRVKNESSARRAEQTLDRMFQMHDNGIPNIKPDAFSYTAILRCYQGLSNPKAAQRGHEILSKMEKLYEENTLDEPPDTFHYTVVCSTWSLSRSKDAPQKCIEILSRMKEKDRQGWPKVKPNIRTYNAVLDSLSRSHQANKAEQLLYHMLSLAKDGVNDARPDSFSFYAVINAFIFSQMRDAGMRAESVLERGLEYAEEDGGQMLDIKSFTSILGYYKRQTKAIDAPYRAQYLLNRLISLYKAGHIHLSPHVSCFTNVMEAYAAQRHRDAGVYSEEILRNMIILQKNYNASNIEVNTGVMNHVLHSWAESTGHNDAGARAEHILTLMEKKSGEGASSMAPNYKSFNLVLRAWSKSTSPNKAENAFDILQRAKKRYQRHPNDYTYSLVIRACAYSNNSGPKIQKKAYGIAVRVMNELIDGVSGNYTEPSSATYAWFFQVTARLQAPELCKEQDIRRIFSRCCRNGRVSDFVLQSMKQATSESFFTEILRECLNVTTSCPDQENIPISKQTIKLTDLPKQWIDSGERRQTGQKQQQELS